jgi:hypothetical protein
VKYFFFYLLFTIPLCAQVLITEVMYDLDGTDSPNEFVELFNPSTTDTVDLAGWQIRDKSSTDAIVDSGFGLELPPLGYGLLLEGDYNFDTGIYADSIPPGVILMKVDDSSIGNGLSTSDSLYLIDSSGTTIDSLGWTDIAPDGFSLEKIRLNYPNTPNNWSASQDSLGTPGTSNSVLPLPVDGELLPDSLAFSPTVILPGELAMFSITITNQGLNTMAGELIISWLENTLETLTVPMMNPLDTLTLTARLGPFPSGLQTISATLVIPTDGDTTNNEGSAYLGVRYPARTFTINEFLPQPSEGQTEFVELIYHGDDWIDLQGWRITDNSAGLAYQLPEAMVAAGEFIIVAHDSALINIVPPDVKYLVPQGGFPSLNNTADEIRVFDPFETLIDSLSYTNHWGYSAGISMEKILPYYSSEDSANWLPAIDSIGVTPGKVNSVTPLALDGALSSSGTQFIPLFPQPDEQVIATVTVVNVGIDPFTATLLVYWNSTLLTQATVPTLAMGETTQVTITLPPFPSGNQLLLFTLDLPGDLNPANNSYTDTLHVRYPFGVVQLNEFMAKPNNDQVEFVELVSLIDTRLEGWSISDNKKSGHRLPTVQVQAYDYLIIAADSTLFPLAPPGVPFLIPARGLPALNNSGDALYLYDMAGTVIDSLNYDSQWPLADERSTEKIRPEFTSSDPRHWKVSTAQAGMTPGTLNSVALFDLDGALLPDSIRHEPHYPLPNKQLRLLVPVLNVGVTDFSGNVTVEEQDEELASVDVPNITPAETTIVTLHLEPLSPGEHALQLVLSGPGDMNPANNIAHDTILVSQPFGTVTINEFFCRPDSNQTEFIELYTSRQIELKNWSLSDNAKRPHIFPTVTLLSDSYLVVSADSSLLEEFPEIQALVVPQEGFPSLNNTSDAIYLHDATGAIIDSLAYTENWPIIDWRSTEKFRPDFTSNDSQHWGLAVNEQGMTPGTVNSVYFGTLPEKGSLQLTPNPFSPDGDGVDDVLTMHYRLPFSQATVRVEIFDVIGRTIATPYWNRYIPEEGILTWTGKRANGKSARTGIYIIKVTARDVATGKHWEKIETVVLAKR